MTVRRMPAQGHPSRDAMYSSVSPHSQAACGCAAAVASCARRCACGPTSTLLRHNPAFTRLYAAQLISFAGDWFATVALLGLALELTGSAAVASLLLVVQTGAFALASPIAGVLADRFDRRRLMVIADLARVPVALAFLLARDPGHAVDRASSRSPCFVWRGRLRADLLGRAANLVEDDELGEANVLIGSAWGTMLAVGAALGGLVAATLGRDAAFVINAASFGAQRC